MSQVHLTKTLSNLRDVPDGYYTREHNGTWEYTKDAPEGNFHIYVEMFPNHYGRMEYHICIIVGEHILMTRKGVENTEDVLQVVTALDAQCIHTTNLTDD